MALGSDRREHERIELTTPVRMWLDEIYQGRQVLFEGFAETRNLAVGGIFVYASYLLPVDCPVNLEVQLGTEGDVLRARGRVSHKKPSDDDIGPGMGIIFTSLDEDNRERLLRYFVTGRIREFYQERFVVEFPRLESSLSLRDVAIIINLWEDRDGRLSSLQQQATPIGAPPPQAKLPAARRGSPRA